MFDVFLRSQTSLLKLAPVRIEKRTLKYRKPTTPDQHKWVHNVWMLFNDVKRDYGRRGVIWNSFGGGAGCM